MLATNRSLVVLSLLLATACTGNMPSGAKDAGAGGGTGGNGASPNAIPAPAFPFEAVAPAVYVTKVKTLMTGSAADGNEVAAVSADGNALRPLVASWLGTAQAQNVLTTFFTTAFQQKNLSPTAFGDQLGGESCGGWWILTHENNFIGRGNDDRQVNARYVQEFTESFGRTVWQLVMVENQPFTSTLTTRRFMMTPTMVSTLLFFDRFRTGFQQTGPVGITPEIGGCGHWGYKDIYSHVYTQEVYNSYQVTSGAIPIADTLNPNSANFMHWNLQLTGTQLQGIPFPVLQAGPDAIYLMLNGMAYSENPNFFVTQVPAQWSDADFNTWKMVTVAQVTDPNAPPPRFWDLPLMRSLNTVPLMAPRVGFFTTPAFFANWLTNQSNQFRVTANQTLIVALGESLLDANVVVRSSNNGADQTATDAQHLANPACASCHVTLDPLRHFFSQAYDPTYEGVTDPNAPAVTGEFLVGGAKKSGKSLDDLGQILAADPAFPITWVNRVCTWANSTPCETSDPELQRIATRFAANNFNFREMLLDVLTSPLVTGAAATQTWGAQGEPLSINRYDHFCTNLTQRLKLANACIITQVAQQNASNVPVDNYVRGSSTPYLPTQPSLFFRTAVENLCTELAAQVVDTATGQYSSSDVPTAVAGMVQTVMGVASNDARYADLVTALSGHYTDAMATGAKATDALRSVFTVACTAPSSVAIGL